MTLLKFLFFSLIFLGSFLEFARLSLAATLEVCSACSLTTLKEAINQAQPGDQIQVRPGLYAEGSLLIQKPLTLKGIDFPIIDGLHQGHVFYVRAPHVVIEGFVIKNSGSSYVSEYAGIRVEESQECRILNNRLENNVYSIYLAHVSSCLVENNQIIGNAQGEVSGGNGIHLWYSDHITIRANEISYHRDGLYLEFSPDSVIEGNRCYHNIRYGLHFMFSARNEYSNNIFSANETGVAVMYSKHVVMKKNRFEKSWGRSSYGLLLKDISDSTIVENIFEGNTVGTFIDGCARNRFMENEWKNNGWAINLFGNTEENYFEQNNFIANFFDVSTNARNPLNTFRFNYWSAYEGYDMDKDGRGDIPFRPMRLFSLWVARYPELTALLGSPVIEFLETAENVFPVLVPEALKDNNPSMRQFL